MARPLPYQGSALPLSYSSANAARSRRKCANLQALTGRFLRTQVTSTMSSKSPSKVPQTREDRLKAALKANLGRRKAQARAKAQQQAGDKAPNEKE